MPRNIDTEGESTRRNYRKILEWNIYPAYGEALRSGVEKLEAIVPGYVIDTLRDKAPTRYDENGDGKYHMLMEITVPEGTTDDQKELARLIIQQVEREAWSD